MSQVGPGTKKGRNLPDVNVKVILDSVSSDNAAQWGAQGEGCLTELLDAISYIPAQREWMSKLKEARNRTGDAAFNQNGHFNGRRRH
jgi:hypothetical protein